MAMPSGAFFEALTVKESEIKYEVIYVLGKVDKVVCKLCDYRSIDLRILGGNTEIGL